MDGSLTTDGCGLIRLSIARKVFAKLKLNPRTSVIQCRWAGAKGLLVVYPDLQFEHICRLSQMDSSRDVKSSWIAIRDSMVKYEGGPTSLEVRDVSRNPHVGHLNKQFITLLLSRDIKLLKVNWFLSISFSMVHRNHSR